MKLLKYISFVLAVLLMTSLLFGCKPAGVDPATQSGGSVPALSAEVKEAILKEGIRRMLFTGTKEPKINWYDENGGVEDGSWRYQGTYGDCVVIFCANSNGDYFNPSTNDQLVDGAQPSTPKEYQPYTKTILGRTITYPMYFSYIVYNPTVEIVEGELFPSSLSPLDLLVEQEDGWLTEEQIHQILDDLEDWIADKHPNT